LVDLNQIDTDHKMMMSGMKKVRMEFDRIEPSMEGAGTDVGESNSFFLKKVEPFLLKAEASCEVFGGKLDTMKAGIIENCGMFGDSMEKWR